MNRWVWVGLLCVLPVLMLTACAPVTPTAPTSLLHDTESADNLPAVVEYTLGETAIVQSSFTEDSRFRKMPVRLNGIIAIPTDTGEAHPVVVIFHGNHPGCPIPEGDHVDRWPCAPEEEQANYRGFAYLVQRLAAQGYVALSVNINAENTFGFGEPLPGERFTQLVDLHLQALAEAASGGVNPFGVDLAGRVDLDRLVWMGHSRGGEAAYSLAQTLEAGQAYGPVVGLLLIAPAVVSMRPADSRVPMAVILPACDGDVFLQDGQHFYEAARLSAEQTQWATSVWLERANHNGFNQELANEWGGSDGRPDCEPLIDAEVQRAFLSDYAVDFLRAIFGADPKAIAGARSRLGIAAAESAPDNLYGLAARVAVLAARAERQPILVPHDAGELTTHLADGEVIAGDVTTVFCEAGYFTPEMRSGSEPCKRVNLVIPGDPAMVVVSWSQPGATLRFILPPGAGDLRRYWAISLRAAVDPLSSLNRAGTAQRFTVQLTDRSGMTATVVTRPAEPALGFPQGLAEENSFFEGGLFTGRVPMTTIRLQLSDFAGVDLSNVGEVALVFDQSSSGALFMGDLEWVAATTE